MATYSVTRRRLEGLRDAWVGSGGDWSEVPVLVCPRNGTGEGEAAVEELLRSGEAPDAIAALSDELALGALRAAARHGVSVPERMAATGWDDSGAADLAGLTTVSQSLREQGAACARLALGGGPRESFAAPWRIVRRASTRGDRDPAVRRSQSPAPGAGQ